MSGIPIYIQAPINAAKADGITPQTATSAPRPEAHVGLSSTVATTTATPSLTPTYPAAQPGAPAVPVPTTAAQRYAPVQPTPTTKISDGGPPSPEPGAFPTPASIIRSGLPPPPKAGETIQSQSHQMAMPQPYPPQMGESVPTTDYGAQLPRSATSTTTTSSSAYPVVLPSDVDCAPRRSFEHPPGYVQNPYASNLSTDYGRTQDTVQHTSGLGGYNSEKPNSTAAFGVDPESVWNTAKDWASAAGKKLSEVESEVWKRVNGGK